MNNYKNIIISTILLFILVVFTASCTTISNSAIMNYSPEYKDSNNISVGIQSTYIFPHIITVNYNIKHFEFTGAATTGLLGSKFYTLNGRYTFYENKKLLISTGLSYNYNNMGLKAEWLEIPVSITGNLGNIKIWSSFRPGIVKVITGDSFSEDPLITPEIGIGYMRIGGLRVLLSINWPIALRGKEETAYEPLPYFGFEIGYNFDINKIINSSTNKDYDD